MGYKKTKKLGGGHNDANTFTLEDIKNDEPVWSSHYDEDYGEVYFYNRSTKKSQWTKPSKFDGYEIMAGQKAITQNEDNEYNRTFG